MRPRQRKLVPRLETMRVALAPRNALEVLLVERVVLTWLALDVCETLYAGVLARQHGIREADYAQRRVDAAQRRYLGSLAALYRAQRQV